MPKKDVNFRNGEGFIAYIVIVAVILAVVFLSQVFTLPFEKMKTQQPLLFISEKVKLYWLDATSWIGKNIYPRVSKEVEDRGGALKDEVEKQKDIAAQSIWEKIKNYFAGKFSSISGTKVE